VLQARSRGPGSHDQILAICRGAGFSTRVVQEGSQIDVVSFVASGAGVAIVPASLRAIRRAGVVYRPLIERPMTQLDMIWRKNASLPVLLGFLEEVRRMGARGIRPHARRGVSGLTLLTPGPRRSGSYDFRKAVRGRSCLLPFLPPAKDESRCVGVAARSVEWRESRV
jgi:hypothetical protein